MNIANAAVALERWKQKAGGSFILGSADRGQSPIVPVFNFQSSNFLIFKFFNTRLRILSILVLASFSVAAAGVVTKDQIVDVTSQLVCLCGCGNKTVSVCGCGLADQTTKDVEKMLQEGKTKDQILAHYIKANGISVLGAPPKSGFNLTAWVLPFLGIFVAGGFLLVKMKHWQADTKKQEADVERRTIRSDASPAADAYRKKMNEELEKTD